MKKLPEAAHAWIEYAENDLLLARKIQDDEDFARHAGFLAQQAGEKYLKAVLAAIGGNVPRIHDLAQLGKMLNEVIPELRTHESDLEWLTTFAVLTRYPQCAGPAVTTAHARRALDIALAIKEICETKLNI